MDPFLASEHPFLCWGVSQGWESLGKDKKSWSQAR